jgi:hypothetical protein
MIFLAVPSLSSSLPRSITPHHATAEADFAELLGPGTAKPTTIFPAMNLVITFPLSNAT